MLRVFCVLGEEAGLEGFLEPGHGGLWLDVDDRHRSPCYFEVAKTLSPEWQLRSRRMGIVYFTIGPLQTGIMAKLVQLAKHPIDPLRTRDGVDLSFFIAGEVLKPKVIERVMEGKIMK